MNAASYSEALLARVRDGMKRRGLNRAALAKRMGADRKQLRSVLAGREALTVDQFFAMVEALGLSPLELGLPADLAGLELGDDSAAVEPSEDEAAEDEAAEDGAPHEPPTLALAPEQAEVAVQLVDPDGPQAAEMLRLGFALGVDIHLACATDQLGQSGIPEAVLSRFPDLLPIKLDAAYHHANRARYLDEHLELRLSFDRVRTCYFPWAAIRQITFFPEPPLDVSPDPDPEVPEPGAGPVLRLVT
jgi:transcriptional regulator with XRE-family HTH domain